MLRVIKGAISVARKVNFISRLTFAIQIATENKRASSQLLSLTSICNVCPQAEGLGAAYGLLRKGPGLTSRSCPASSQREV